MTRFTKAESEDAFFPLRIYLGRVRLCLKVLFLLAGFGTLMGVAAFVDNLPNPFGWIIAGMCGALVAKWVWEWTGALVLRDWAIFEEKGFMGLLALVFTLAFTVVLSDYSPVPVTLSCLWICMIYFVFEQLNEDFVRPRKRP